MAANLHCARCGRVTLHPAVVIGTQPFGPTCARKVAKLQASLDGCKTKAERAAVGKEICVLNLQINELKGGSKAGGRDFANYLCDVIKESVPKLTWERYVAEARKRHEAAEASVPSREEVAAC